MFCFSNCTFFSFKVFFFFLKETSVPATNLTAKLKHIYQNTWRKTQREKEKIKKSL